MSLFAFGRAFLRLGLAGIGSAGGSDGFVLLEGCYLLLGHRLVLVLVPSAAAVQRPGQLLRFLVVLVDRHVQVVLLVILLVHLDPVILLLSVHFLLLLSEKLAVLRICCHICPAMHVELVRCLAFIMLFKVKLTRR